MKISKKFFISVIFLSLILNIIFLAKISYLNKEYERPIIGTYKVDEYYLVFSDNNTVRFSDSKYYIEQTYEKIGENMYVFDNNKNLCFVFWYDNNFHIFISEIQSAKKLQKISALPTINNTLEKATNIDIVKWNIRKQSKIMQGFYRFNKAIVPHNIYYVALLLYF